MKTITRLLKHAALLSVTIAVYKDGAMLSSTTVPSDSFWGLDVQTLVCEDIGSVAGVDCGSTTVKLPSFQTGPFVPLCVSTATNSDCYLADGINPNGSLINLRWVAHPL